MLRASVLSDLLVGLYIPIWSPTFSLSNASDYTKKLGQKEKMLDQVTISLTLFYLERNIQLNEIKKLLSIFAIFQNNSVLFQLLLSYFLLFSLSNIPSINKSTISLAISSGPFFLGSNWINVNRSIIPIKHSATICVSRFLRK